MALIDRTGVTETEAARAKGVGARTVRRAKAATRRRAAGSPKAPPAGSQAAATANVALPQGGTVSGRPDLLALVREILDARYPAARAELDEGLRIHARGEPDLFAAWKGRPPDAAEPAGDELEALGAVLADLRALLAKAGPDAGPRIAIVKALDGVSKSLSVVKSRRAPEVKPDEVNERIRAADDACVEHLLRHTREAAAKLERDRAELVAWGRGAFGEHGGGELERRVGAMLGGAT